MRIDLDDLLIEIEEAEGDIVGNPSAHGEAAGRESEWDVERRREQDDGTRGQVRVSLAVAEHQHGRSGRAERVRDRGEDRGAERGLGRAGERGNAELARPAAA